MKTLFFCLVFLIAASSNVDAQTINLFGKDVNKESTQSQAQTKSQANQSVQITTKVTKLPTLEDEIQSLESKLKQLKERPRIDKEAAKKIETLLKEKRQALARQKIKIDQKSKQD